MDYSSLESWVEDPESKAFKRRRYSSYEDYLQHQKSKLEAKGKDYLAEYDHLFHRELLQRLQKLDSRVSFRGKSALCLAARLGTEVRAFIDIGCFVVGLDLNPGTENKYVVYGDFHDIQFATDSVDIIYTNSFDHVFDKDRVIKEITRLLRKNGFLLLEVPFAKEGKRAFGTYESFYWDDPSNVIQLFIDRGFRVVECNNFDYPWRGRQILFILAPKS